MVEFSIVWVNTEILANVPNDTMSTEKTLWKTKNCNDFFMTYLLDISIVKKKKIWKCTENALRERLVGFQRFFFFRMRLDELLGEFKRTSKYYTFIESRMVDVWRLDDRRYCERGYSRISSVSCRVARTQNPEPRPYIRYYYSTVWLHFRVFFLCLLIHSFRSFCSHFYVFLVMFRVIIFF